MHTRTIVLLPPGAKNLWQVGADLLQLHRVDWDDDSKPSRIDYWAVGHGSIADEFTATALGVVGDPDLARNVCFVSRLRPEFEPGAMVTPDGRWYDLFDHGWRFVDGDSPANRTAAAAWAAQVQDLLRIHADCVAVEFDTHS